MMNRSISNYEMLPKALREAYEADLREAYEADEEAVNSYLSGEGFDHITKNGAIALASIAVGGESAGNLMRIMGISQDVTDSLVEALIQGGYLVPQAEADNHASLSDITARGHSVLSAIRTGIKLARYVGFQPREGDIIISTLPKSGTTWMQMICALLIFQTPDLPAPLYALSPTLDPRGDSFDVLREQLAEQQHRRFIKTHLPLHMMKIDPRITYIIVARHPLDSAISLYHQERKVSSEVRNLRGDGLGQHDEAPQRDAEPSSTPHGWLLKWIEEDSMTDVERISKDWSHRGEPNIVFVHYADLSADLDNEMRRLASRLGIVVPEGVWPSLVEAATFKQMKANAKQIQPVAPRRLASKLAIAVPAVPEDAVTLKQKKANAEQIQPAGLEKSLQRTNEAFFRKGASGSGQELLTSAELADYYRRAARVAPPELLTWLHRPYGPGDVTMSTQSSP
jgi:aryl sulfotransferase